MGNHHGRHSNPGHQSSGRLPPYKFGPYSENTAPTTSTSTGNPNMGLCLPYGHVDSSLRALAGQGEGFGRFAVGGLHGAVYRVTNLGGKGNWRRCVLCAYVLFDLIVGFFILLEVIVFLIEGIGFMWLVLETICGLWEILEMWEIYWAWKPEFGFLSFSFFSPSNYQNAIWIIICFVVLYI